MIGIILVMLVVGFLFALYAGMQMEKADNKGDGSTSDPGSFIAAIVLIGAAVIMMYYHGAGELLSEKSISLKTNAIYETLSLVPDDGKYVAVLRNDGQRIAYLLDKEPPPLFKYTGKLDDPYQILLPIPVAHVTSISHKK